MSVSEKSAVSFLWATPNIEVVGSTEPSVANCCITGRNIWAGSAPGVRYPSAVFLGYLSHPVTRPTGHQMSKRRCSSRYFAQTAHFRELA